MRMSPDIGPGLPWSFSRKQLAMMLWWQVESCRRHDGLIAYGSVRSGKSVGMSNGFILWAMTMFAGQNFGICGKTIGAIRRNVVDPLKHTLVDFGFVAKEKRSDNLLTVTAKDGHQNFFYEFGGNDEKSQDLIQGVTLAGVYLDEVTLMPQSFVNQALARCSVGGATFWFNCNPESPSHWFKVDFVDRAVERNLLVMHCTMADNASLTDDVKQRYARTFPAGVFRRRYIYGEWCVSEGLVYPEFDPETSCIDFTDADLFSSTVNGERIFNSERFGFAYLTVDYGTANPTAAYLTLWDKQNLHFVVAREWYWDGHKRTQLDDVQKYEALERLASGVPIKGIIIDPSALSLITLIKKKQKFLVLPADNRVVPGIAFTQTCLAYHKILIAKTCVNMIAEFGKYRWDEKAQASGIDRPLKQDDHAMDALRYWANSFIRTKAARFGITTLGGTDKYKKYHDRLGDEKSISWQEVIRVAGYSEKS